MNFPIVAEKGIKILGIYIFVIRDKLPDKLFAESVMALEKNVQGTKAVKLNIWYGTPSESILANLPKITVNTSIKNNGWIIAHPIPITDCAYLAFISLRIKKYNKSLYSKISLKFGKYLDLGLIILILFLLLFKLI